MNDRLRIHQDLLDQVAASEEERETVRRVLYAPLRTAADLRACSRCESGLTHCTTPDACERAESSASYAERVGAGIVLIVVAVLLAGAIATAALIMAGVTL